MTALTELKKLQVAAGRYRSAIDRILDPRLATSKDWQACVAKILICTTRLYLSYLLTIEGIHELESLVSRKGAKKKFSTDNAREMRLRVELRQRLESPTSWPGFVPINPFSDLTGLKSLQDYVDNFTLHLPEIYEETFRVEACVKSFLTDRNSSALAQLSVGLQHLGRYHASFALPALEWAADEGSWESLLLTKGR